MASGRRRSRLPKWLWSRPTEITATTGGSAKAGSWNLYVIDSGGTSSANPGDDYTYVSLTVSSVSPASGSVNGGTPIRITGTGFVPGATVEIAQGNGVGPTAIPASKVVVVSPTEITATTGGSAKPGTWNLFVTESGAASSANPGDDYTYVSLTVSSVSPASGSVNGGTPIRVTGTGFVPGATCGDRTGQWRRADGHPGFQSGCGLSD